MVIKKKITPIFEREENKTESSNKKKTGAKKKDTEAKITKKATFSELIQSHPEAVEPLMEAGMHCIGCPASQFETIEEGAMMHGLDPDELVEKINQKIKEQK